jgi:hypothetical protein
MTERGRSVLTWVLAIGLLWMAGVAGHLLRFKHNAMLYMIETGRFRPLA